MISFEEARRAIKRGDVDLLRAELNDGLDPNLTHRFGATILAVAAVKGDTRIGKLLIEKGADINRRDRGTTPLSSAIMAGQTSFVRLLLESGASLECHPHGNSLSIFLDWVEKYCGLSDGQMKNIRELFEAELHRGEQTSLA